MDITDSRHQNQIDYNACGKMKYTVSSKTRELTVSNHELCMIGLEIE